MPVSANIHPHMRPYADIWLPPRRAAARLSALDTAFETERPHRLPRQFPKLLARAPDPASGLGGVPQRHLVVVVLFLVLPTFPRASFPCKRESIGRLLSESTLRALSMRVCVTFTAENVGVASLVQRRMGSRLHGNDSSCRDYGVGSDREAKLRRYPRKTRKPPFFFSGDV